MSEAGIVPEPTPKSPISTIDENIGNSKHQSSIAALLPADWGPIMEVFRPVGSEEGVNGVHLGRAPLGSLPCYAGLVWSSWSGNRRAEQHGVAALSYCKQVEFSLWCQLVHLGPWFEKRGPSWFQLSWFNITFFVCEIWGKEKVDFPSGWDLKSLMSDNMKEKLTVEVDLICNLKSALTILNITLF